MDATFSLGLAAPAAGTRIFAGRRPARARHAADRKVTRGDQRMRRQFCHLVDRLDLLARNIGERVELQFRAVVLDNRYLSPRATLKTLASVDPGRERL